MLKLVGFVSDNLIGLILNKEIDIIEGNLHSLIFRRKLYLHANLQNCVIEIKSFPQKFYLRFDCAVTLSVNHTSPLTENMSKRVAIFMLQISHLSIDSTCIMVL